MAKKEMEVSALAYTREQMMSIFQISATTLWRHTKDGKLPAPNRSWGHPRWNKAEIEALFNV